MDTIPPYVRQTLEKSSTALSNFASDGSEDAVAGATREVADLLDRWAGDDDFWSATADGLTEPAADFDEVDDDQELDVIARALDDDRHRALPVLLELRTGQEPDVDRARDTVRTAAAEGAEIVDSPNGRRRAWRAARFLRKALTIGAGGLGIAADIVSPDVTGITKVASIAGGVATIVGTGR